MSEKVAIPAHEHGVLRLFALSMDPAEAETLHRPEALAAALGVEQVDPEHAEVIAIGDVGAIGLASYLTEGMGARPDAVRPLRPKLDALEGHVLLVRSAAFGAREQTLDPDARLTLIATLPEDSADPPPMTPLRSESAAPGQAEAPAPIPPDPPTRAGKAGLLAVLAGLAALVILALFLGAG